MPCHSASALPVVNKCPVATVKHGRISCTDLAQMQAVAGGHVHTAFWEISVEIEGQAEGRFICSLGAGRPVGIPVASSSLLAAAECDHILHIPVAFY